MNIEPISTFITAISTAIIAWKTWQTGKIMEKQNKIADEQKQLIKKGFNHTQRENINFRISDYCLEALSIINDIDVWLIKLRNYTLDEFKKRSYEKIIDDKKVRKLQIYYDVILSHEVRTTNYNCTSLLNLSEQEDNLIYRLNSFRQGESIVIDDTSSKILDDDFERFKSCVYDINFSDCYNFFQKQLTDINSEKDISNKDN